MTRAAAEEGGHAAGVVPLQTSGRNRLKGADDGGRFDSLESDCVLSLTAQYSEAVFWTLDDCEGAVIAKFKRTTRRVNTDENGTELCSLEGRSASDGLV